VAGTQVELGLLEREGELAVLGSLVGAAERGEGTLAVIEGTAGIGKTRLLAEMRGRAGAGMRVLSARGGELEGDFAFGVVRQLFEPLLAAAEPERRAELVSGAAALAAPLFESRSVGSWSETEGDVSFAVLHGLYWLAANAALEQPTMVAIDDLHWSDTPSLRWLCYLARRLEGLPLLVVVAMWPAEQGRDPELLDELLADPATTAVHPGPLNADSIAALARRRFEGDYHVFILSRVREAFDRGLTTEEAVGHGIKTTAGVVSSAAVVMVGVFSIFATLPIIDMKEMGIGLAAAVLIDATIVRAVLLPATMKLLGDWNWYLPHWLDRGHAGVGRPMASGPQA